MDIESCRTSNNCFSDKNIREFFYISVRMREII